jgi:hypothetical protein
MALRAQIANQHCYCRASAIGMPVWGSWAFPLGMQIGPLLLILYTCSDLGRIVALRPVTSAAGTTFDWEAVHRVLCEGAAGLPAELDDGPHPRPSNPSRVLNAPVAGIAHCCSRPRLWCWG